MIGAALDAPGVGKTLPARTSVMRDALMNDKGLATARQSRRFILYIGPRTAYFARSGGPESRQKRC
jgi:hypothetical protein